MADPLQEISDQVKRQMNQLPIHQSWEKDYRTPENEKFFELAFDRIVQTLGQPKGSRALDIGCGICANSIRLARRGYVVSAGDYSEPILGLAQENVARNQLSDQISIGREDAYDLSFPSDHFDLALCWGVLMHLPDAERAIAELIRVVKPGGYVVLEEINQNSPESRMMRLFWSTLKKKKITITKTPAGSEQRCAFGGEALFWRHTDSHWLIEQFGGRSCTLVRLDCSLCSELMMYIPGRLPRALINAWNRFWLRRVNIHKFSYHSIFIFRKNPG